MVSRLCHAKHTVFAHRLPELRIQSAGSNGKDGRLPRGGQTELGRLLYDQVFPRSGEDIHHQIRSRTHGLKCEELRGEVGNRPFSNDRHVADGFSLDIVLARQALFKHTIYVQTPIGVLHDGYDVLGADRLNPVRHLEVKERVGWGNAEDIWILPGGDHVGPSLRDDQGELAIIGYLDLCLGHRAVELADHSHSPGIGEPVHRGRPFFGKAPGILDLELNWPSEDLPDLCYGHLHRDLHLRPALCRTGRG